METITEKQKMPIEEFKYMRDVSLYEPITNLTQEQRDLLAKKFLEVDSRPINPLVENKVNETAIIIAQIVYNLVLVTGTGYAVFSLGYSGWWFLLTALFLANSLTENNPR